MKYFGTDGIRGVAGETLTTDFVRKVGFAYGVALSERFNLDLPVVQTAKNRVLIGRDTRVSGREFSLAVSEGIRHAGLDVVCAGVITTPTHNFCTSAGDFLGGVMITASHNPASHNGIKLCDSSGKKYSPDFLSRVESLIDKGICGDFDEKTAGKITIDLGLGEQWIDFLLSKLDNPDLSGIKVALDLANGAGYELIPRAFSKAGAEVVTFNAESGGAHINDLCGSLFVDQFVSKVIKCGADIGFSFDGDADRILAVDKSGRVIDGTDLMYIFGKFYSLKNRLTSNAVVTTPITNMGLEISLNKCGISLVRTEKVGGQYVQALMEKRGFVVGGEENGHILLNDIGEGSDGLCVGLSLLKIMRETKRNLSELLSGLERKKTAQSNLKVTNNQRERVQNGCLAGFLNELDSRLDSSERVIVRPSGTECLVRILVEGDNQSRLDKICQEIEKKITAL